MKCGNRFDFKISFVKNLFVEIYLQFASQSSIQMQNNANLDNALHDLSVQRASKEKTQTTQ